jgi:STE24 endopeptidase
MWVFTTLLILQFVISTALSIVNLEHLKRSAASPPQEWAERLPVSQFSRMVDYTAAKSRLGHVVRTIDIGVTLAILVSGLLATIAQWAASLPIAQVWQGLIVLAIPAVITYLTDIPWDLVSHFGVEKKFGFSTITIKTWLADQAKAFLISLVLGALVGGGLLFLIGWLAHRWWLPAWILFSLFQALITFIAPVLILPLFNTFEPLQDLELCEQITTLAQKANFPLGGVFQIDASLRSTHSNAFFTGLGKTRRIALFDTLLDQHSREEILAITAHEIGHWKRRHMLKMMIAGGLVSGIGFALVALLIDTCWLYKVFDLGNLYAQTGAAGPVAAVGLYLIGILLSPLGLILTPIANWFSRKHEYEADAYSLALYDHPTALEEGLIKLSEKNLSNLFPHPLIVMFRYSHPPLFDRVAAIQRRSKVKQPIRARDTERP